MQGEGLGGGRREGEARGVEQEMTQIDLGVKLYYAACMLHFQQCQKVTGHMRVKACKAACRSALQISLEENKSVDLEAHIRSGMEGPLFGYQRILLLFLLAPLCTLSNSDFTDPDPFSNYAVKRLLGPYLT